MFGPSDIKFSNKQKYKKDTITLYSVGNKFFCTVLFCFTPHFLHHMTRKLNIEKSSDEIERNRKERKYIIRLKNDVKRTNYLIGLYLHIFYIVDK